MSRFPAALRTLSSLAAFVAVAACSSDANKAADTAAVVTNEGVTSTATATSTPVADTTVAAIVPININTATDAEILRIPGVGPRMLREFKEYRPYTSIEQFRREIGKYVDKAEVARLEKYIVIK
jgi:DNA uptake protein ComE-like DNA-binding protein